MYWNVSLLFTWWWLDGRMVKACVFCCVLVHSFCLEAVFQSLYQAQITITETGLATDWFVVCLFSLHVLSFLHC